MGIINLTPDSFYHGSRYTAERAVEVSARMLAEGATILDLGPMSTRPGAVEISESEEMHRLIPSLQNLRKAFPDAFISVDTYRSAVAAEALLGGADMINDISGGTFDEAMMKTVAAHDAAYVIMHTQGKPSVMQQKPVYKNIEEEVFDFLRKQAKLASEAGITSIAIDPGFGFGKTLEHNYTLLSALRTFTSLGYPLLVGFSRKSMISKPLGITARESLNGTTVLNTIALMNGADILRVHDVKEAVEAKRLLEYYQQTHVTIQS